MTGLFNRIVHVKHVIEKAIDFITSAIMMGMM